VSGVRYATPDVPEDAYPFCTWSDAAQDRIAGIRYAPLDKAVLIVPEQFDASPAVDKRLPRSAD
jgi:hypothetical protein